MNEYQIVAVLLVLAALFSWTNERGLKLTESVGLMLQTMILVLILHALAVLGWDDGLITGRAFVQAIDFPRALMQNMLCFLLFAGAMHVPLSILEREKWHVLLLAVFSTLASTALIGLTMRFLLGLAGVDLPLIHALLFGAVISPTDPVAALAILKDAGLPRTLQTLIEGESLFNDGVGVVVFTVLAGLAAGGESTLLEGVALFVREALGGAGLGVALGFACYGLLRGTTRETTRLLITLSVVVGGFELASLLHVSGPIAMVAAGLVVGNVAEKKALDREGRLGLDSFWRFVDEVLNALLFVLLGLHMLIVGWSLLGLAAIGLAVACVLAARWISVAGAIAALNIHGRFGTQCLPLVNLLTWSGLKGGLAVALVLSLDKGPHQDLLLLMTFGVMAFSILVQGLTVDKMFTLDQLDAMTREVDKVHRP